MKHSIWLLVAGLALTIFSCKKDDGTITPPDTTEDFSYPANTTKFSATLFTSTTSIAVNGTFDVRFVLYNVTSAFGAASEITFSNDKVQVTESVVGPAIGPADAVISLRGPVPTAPNTYAFGVTYRAGSTSSLTGSGVIVKLKCKAIAAGTANFTINPAKLEIKKSDGTPISNFGTILIENASVTIN